MADVTTVLREHPVAAGGVLVGVIILAYMQSRNSGGSQSPNYQYRGEIAAGIDPNAAAIEQAAISAGTQNLGTIAQLVGLQDSNATALTGSLAQTSAARDVSLSQTQAGKDVSLANIAANLRASLFQSEVQRDTSLATTGAAVSIAQGQNATTLAQSQINATVTQQQIDAARYAAKLQADNENFAIQADKDKARAQANSSIFGSIIGGIVSLFA